MPDQVTASTIRFLRRRGMLVLPVRSLALDSASTRTGETLTTVAGDGRRGLRRHRHSGDRGGFIAGLGDRRDVSAVEKAGGLRSYLQDEFVDPHDQLALTIDKHGEPLSALGIVIDAHDHLCFIQGPLPSPPARGRSLALET